MRAWDYPHDTVNIRCRRCPRVGRYSKAKFVKLVGKDTQLPDTLSLIAGDCPKSHGLFSSLDERCGAHFPDLGKKIENKKEVFR